MKPDDRPPQVPPGAIPAGDGYLYPDNTGGTHRTAGDAIRENQRRESDQSRGASGGCGQDADNVPRNPYDR